LIVTPPTDADRPAKTLSKEDFPAPLGPRIAQIFPEGTLRIKM
jgi:hypothetical protein